MRRGDGELVAVPALGRPPVWIPSASLPLARTIVERQNHAPRFLLPGNRAALFGVNSRSVSNREEKESFLT